MLFNSVVFLTIFLPIALIGWYLLKKLNTPLFAKLFLIGMSLWFYGYYNPSYLLVLTGSLVINYGFSMVLERIKGTGGRRKALILGILANVGILFYFKYFNFFLDNCNYFFHQNLQLEKIALPLGISFFTFQQISFLADRYMGRAEHYSPVDYACFVTFFPQLIAGPIVLHSEFLPQLKESPKKPFDKEMFYDGAALFTLGFAKKVLLADNLALVVNSVFDVLGVIPYCLDIWTGWVTAVCFALQLYFDFSGYCDMARGIGGMFGFTLPENFSSPYKSASVKEMWRRWHMTLGRFLTTYIYIPLGGNRKGKVRTCINLFVVFLVSGLWHGAAWTFVLWGAMNGLAVVWETVFPNFKFRSHTLNVIKTQIFWILAFVTFRCNSITDAFLYYKYMFTRPMQNYFFRYADCLTLPETYIAEKAVRMFTPDKMWLFYWIVLAILLLISFLVIRGKEAKEWIRTYACKKSGAFVLAFLFVWSFLSLSQVSTFLYFNF